MGNYKDDEKSGNGEYKWTDKVFKGNWERGLMDGEGFYTSSEGVLRRGLWKNGQRQKWFKEKINS